MFELPVLLFVTVIMSIVQISIWQMFPPKLRDLMFCNPIFAFLINLAGSGLIAAFTGIASFVGICNLGASVIFGIYAWWYKGNRGIIGIGIDWFKLWKVIPVFPKLVVLYDLNGKKWTV
jgi:hypothetical protein